MSTPSTPPAEATQPQRAKKRIYIPLILIILVVAVAIAAYVRGTWADSIERNPATADAGTITQLHQKANGNVEVRCAVIVDAPPKEVWAVVTDYPSHAAFLPYVKEVAGIRQADGRFLVKGVAHSRLYGDWPFESLTTHAELPGDEYTTSWTEEEKDHDVFAASRGGWSVRPVGKDNKQTLLVFTLQVELQKCPNFIVRNIIMDRLHSLVKAMRDETLKRKKA